MKKVLRKTNLVAGMLILIVVCLGIVLAGNVVVKEGDLSAAGTGTFDELTITAPSGNYYNFTSIGTETLSLQSQTSGQRCIFDMFTKDGDSTDVVSIVMWAMGTPSDITNAEYMQIQYETLTPGWLYRSLALGDGDVLPLTFQTGSSLHYQLYLDTDEDIGIGTRYPSYALDVSGSIHCTGYLKADSVEPAYVLYDYETRHLIIEKVKEQVPTNKLNGAVLFYNGEEDRMEIFIPSKGEFRDLTGKVLASVAPINGTYEAKGTKYYFDKATGEVKAIQVYDTKKYKIKDEYGFDEQTGTFYKVELEPDPRETIIKAKSTVPKEEAIELINGDGDAE